MKRHDRQADIIKPAEVNFNIHIIGAGGIGSWTALLLAKMGCKNIIVYDDDVVENHNVASQFFKESQLGKLKIEALKESIEEQAGIEIQTANNEVEEQIKKGLVIIAMDSMEERIRLGNIYKDKDIYIIDGRMGGLQLEIYCSKAKNYLKTTAEPEGVDHDPCTAKSIGFNCAVIGGLISNFVRQYAKKKIVDCEIIYDFINNTFLKDDYKKKPKKEEKKEEVRVAERVT